MAGSVCETVAFRIAVSNPPIHIHVHLEFSMSLNQNAILASSAVHWPIGGGIVTSLSDGYFDLPLAHVLTNLSPQDAEAALYRAGRPAAPRLEVNAYLIRRAGEAPILVDTGSGSGFGPTAGRLPAALAGIGVDPAEIGTVLLTHLHGDHAGGLLGAEGQAAFPNAEIVLHAAEAAFWLQDATAADQQSVDFARAAVAPYRDRMRRVEEGKVMDGIAAVFLPGHTPGHSGYRIGEGEDAVLIWGDLVNQPAIQPAYPEAGFFSDADAALAVRTRRDTLAKAAEENLLVAGMHIEFPGFARVVREGAGFRLVPAQWVASLRS
jgi:glyoxylase-like metal-dependent hydrolase (beta-lactamase superfamily II)